MIRRLLGALAAVAALGVLTGCVTIPTSGALTEHQLRGADEPPDVSFLASGPGRGDTPKEILEGFIRAGIDVRNRYETARSFLTGDLAGKWNPSASVLVTDGSQNRVDSDGATTASLGVQVAAKVDAIGQYSANTEPVTTTLAFSFQRVRGQWRISSAPDGTVLAPTNFSLLFDAYPVYFLDPTRAYFVPDLRWFLRDQSTPERIVRALLTGPAPWLGSGAVLSAFAKGTQLGNDGVTIANGVATVDLSSDVLSADAATRRRMVAQLRASLDAIGTVTSVTLTARGFPVDVPGGGATPVIDPLVSALPLGATASTLGTVGSSAVSPLDRFPQYGANVVPLRPSAATLDRDQSTLAVLTGGGAYRVSGSADPAAVDRRSAQVAPSIDPQGFVWTAQSSGLGTLQATDAKGEAHAVATGSSVDGALIGFRISRDGARVAVAVATVDGPVVMVGAIQRDASLTPTGIGPLLSIPVSADALVDLAWSDPVTLALLVRQGGEVRVVGQQVGGQSSDLGRPGDGVQIVGGNGGADGLRVLTSGGSLLQQTSGGGWQTTGPGGLVFLVVQQ